MSKIILKKNFKWEPQLNTKVLNPLLLSYKRMVSYGFTAKELCALQLSWHKFIFQTLVAASDFFKRKTSI